MSPVNEAEITISLEPDEIFTGANGRITTYESFSATGLVEKNRIAP
jgi:serine/threonine protein kinase